MRPFWYIYGCNFGTISGAPSFDPEVDIENDLESSNECHFCVQRPKVDLGTKFEGNLNPSLNLSLTSRTLPRTTIWYIYVGTAVVVLFYLAFW